MPGCSGRHSSAAYDGLTNGDYVDALDQPHRSQLQPERARGAGEWLEQRNVNARGRAAARLRRTDGFVSAKRNETFVMMQYFGYLRRDPDAAGYAFWLTS